MRKKSIQSAPKQTRYSLRLPAEILEKFKARAGKHDRSVAGEIVNALRRAVETPGQ